MYMRLYQRTWKEPIEKMLGSIFEGRCCQNAMKLSNVKLQLVDTTIVAPVRTIEVEKVRR